MSDDLIVSGGGSTAVAVDELFADVVRLGSVEATVEDWLGRLGVISRGVGVTDLSGPTSAEGTPAWESLGIARVAFEQAHDRVRWLRRSLVESAERYGATERTVDALWGFGAALAAPLLGAIATSPLVLGGAALAAGGQWAGSQVWQQNGLGPTPLEAWLRDHRGLLSDPAFVRVVRIVADHADSFLAGAAHVPLPPHVLAALGANVDAPENASMLLGAAGLVGLFGSRVLVDGPVQVTRSPQSPQSNTAPPAGVGDLADRVPYGERAPQIRIERFGDGEERRFIVYVGGTVDFGLTAGAQPADMTNNLHGIADDSPLDVLRHVGEDSGAIERAVRAAMKEEGVKSEDPIIAVGYSAGGIVAADLAADPALNVVAAVNLGGPVASAPTREGVPLLSLGHKEDLTPAVGGSGHPSTELIMVSRSVLDQAVDYDDVLPAHDLTHYRSTAALIDDSPEERLVEFKRLVSEFTDTDTGYRTDYSATRTGGAEP